jgi:hypothetical protein
MGSSKRRMKVSRYERKNRYMILTIAERERNAENKLSFLVGSVLVFV